MKIDDFEKLNAAEKALWELRNDLAQLADKFIRLREGCYHASKQYPSDRRVAGVCKAVDGDIGETLLIIDEQMDWEEDE